MNPVFNFNELFLLPDYVISSFVLILFALVFNYILFKKGFFKVRIEYFNEKFMWLTIFSLLIFSFFVVDWGFTTDLYRKSLLTNPILWTLLIFFLFLFSFYQKISDQIKAITSRYIFGFIVLFIIYLGYQVPFNEFHRYNENAQNFQNVLHAINQVSLGKHIFFDLISQYGGYPIFLKPILTLFGINLITISTTLGIILSIVFFIWGFFLYRVIHNKFLVLIGFLSYIYIHLFSTTLWPYQLFFPYFPIRIFFPALMILMGYFYFKKPNIKNFILTLVILSMGVIWNADVGIVCLLAFTLTVSFQKFCEKESFLKRFSVFFIEIFKCFLIPIIILSLYSLYYKLTLGSWADYTMQFAVHEYYISGYSSSGLSNLKLNGTWILIVATYIFALNYSIWSMLNRKNYTNTIIFLITIFGIGSFSYHAYTHQPQVAARVSYPAIFLIIFYIDNRIKNNDFNLILKIKSIAQLKNPYNLLPYLLLLFLLLCTSLLVMDYKNPFRFNHVRIHEFYLKNNSNSKILWEEPGLNGKYSVKYVRMTDFHSNEDLVPRWKDRYIKIKRLLNKYKISKDDKIIIFSTWDAYLYMKLKIKSPLSIANSYHIMQANQGDQVLDYIELGEADWIFFDEDPFLLHAKYSYWTNDIPNVINRGYKKIETVPLMHNYHDGWNQTVLSIFKRKD